MPTFELTSRAPTVILERLMAPPPRQSNSQMDAEVREKIHLEILKRTGAYHANDHVLLPSGHHTSEYIEKTLVTTEASFTEGLGAVIAKHFAQWPIDVVLSTGPGALILSHCVARAHPSRPTLAYGTKGVSGGKRRVTLPVEFQRLIRAGTKVLIVEDLVSSGTTVRLLSQLVEEPGRPGHRNRRAVAPDQEVGDRRQGDLQPREPRLPDLHHRELPALQEGRGAQPGVREAPRASQAVLRAREDLSSPRPPDMGAPRRDPPLSGIFSLTPSDPPLESGQIDR